MKKINAVLAVIAVFSASAFITIQSTNWKLKEDAYSVTFRGKKVDGIIKGLKTIINFDAAKPENSTIKATLDVESINTGNGLMNKHAKSESGLDVKNFPSITFESTSVKAKDGAYNANGKLTIKGVTKNINLPFKFVVKGTEAEFVGQLTISPKDYNITRSGTPESLEITIKAPVTK